MEDNGNKKFYYLAVAIGSTVGAYVPTIFGVDILSMWSIFSSAVFALVAIYITYKLLGY